MGLTLVLDLILVALVLVRQRSIRPLALRLRLFVPTFLFVVGMLQLRAFTAHHPVSPAGAGALTLCFAVGAVVLGWWRALTVRIWPAGPFLLRQGTWLTMGLWLVSLGLLVVFAGVVPTSTAPAGLAGASLLAYTGVTYATQAVAVRRRALALRRGEGPIDVESTTVGAERPGADPGGPGARPTAATADQTAPSAIEVRSWSIEQTDEPEDPEDPER